MAKTLTKGARITGAQRGSLGEEYARRYEAGESIRAIAESVGRSFGFVHGVLRETGVTLRSRGGATRGTGRVAPAGRPDPAGQSATMTKKRPAPKARAKKAAANKGAAKKGAAKAGSAQAPTT